MAYERPGESIGFLPADIDMSGKTNGIFNWQFQPVWLAPGANVQGHGNGGAVVTQMGSLTSPPLGILQNAPLAGEAANVMTTGVSKLRAYGTWAVGDPIGVNGSGQAVKAGTGVYAFATALESAVTGDIATVLLRPRGVQ